MRHTVLAAALALILGQAPGQEYTGTWVAELDGTTYARLELSVTRGAIGGSLSLGDIHLDPSGAVATALPVPREFTPVFAVTVGSAGISFSRKNDDDVEQFQMHLIGGDEAELAFLPTPEELRELADNGVAPPKPFRMKKVVR